MESQLQKIIASIVGIIIFFIIPVYLVFEKVDDVSYNLVLKATQNFVDNVREKGYISPEMYDNYVMSMNSSNNFYDVQIEHLKKRYDPAIFVYSKSGKLLHTLDYDKYIGDDGKLPDEIKIQEGNSLEGNKRTVTYNSENSIFSTGHSINIERITDKQIVDRLFLGTSITKEEYIRDCMMGNTSMYESLRYLNENSYIMNEGDKIIVSIRNTNQTIASVFYSTFTASVGLEEIPKVFVNYGGTIKNNGATLVSDINGALESELGRMFKYKGEAQEIILDKGTYDLECWGASGGGTTTKKGKGAYTRARFEFDKSTTLYLYVGGQGTKYTESNVESGGWNGGGNSYNGYGGGGATDIRLIKGTWSDSTSLLSRIIVAGGGGGSSKKNPSGNAGYGGYAGNMSSSGNGGITGYYGKGAISTQVSVGWTEFLNEDLPDGSILQQIPPTEKGNFGIGGSVDYDGAGAGGSGYHGGSSAHNQYLGRRGWTVLYLPE